MEERNCILFWDINPQFACKCCKNYRILSTPWLQAETMMWNLQNSNPLSMTANRRICDNGLLGRVRKMCSKFSLAKVYQNAPHQKIFQLISHKVISPDGSNVSWLKCTRWHECQVARCPEMWSNRSYDHTSHNTLPGSSPSARNFSASGAFHAKSAKFGLSQGSCLPCTIWEQIHKMHSPADLTNCEKIIQN